MKLIMSDLENGQTFSRATVARSVIWVNIIQQKKSVKLFKSSQLNILFVSSGLY
jgi:hypothetical protein